MSVPKGTYTIIFTLERSAAVSVGALGETQFRSGAYGYTGSAFGNGGLSRVGRHIQQLAGDKETTHWHIDYLTTHTDTQFHSVTVERRTDIECHIACQLSEEPARVTGFGCSDCDCQTHLSYRESKHQLLNDCELAYGQFSS